MNRHILRILSLAMITAGCAKIFPEKWPDGVEAEIFSKAELVQFEAKITLGQDTTATDRDLTRLQAIGQSLPTMVSTAETDGRLKSMFKDLAFAGVPGRTYSVIFKVDKKFVTAFKVVPRIERASLSLLERQLTVIDGERVLLPIFQYDVEAQGVVERTKNDLGEDTRTLQLKETDPDKATHIRMSTLVQKRRDVAVPESNLDEVKQVFVKDEILGHVFSKDELSQKLKVQISEDGLFLADIKGQTMGLFKIVRLVDLNAQQRDLIASGRGGDDAKFCTEQVLDQIPSALRDQCVQILTYQIDAITFLKARRQLADRSGILSNTIEFVDESTAADAAFVRIARDPAVRPIDRLGQVTRLDPRSTLDVDSLRQKEFSFRRTLKDSPNTFGYTFAGSSGRLELVKFVFEDTSVRVVRADALLTSAGGSALDRETLMVLPAKYFNVQTIDDRGQEMAEPKLVPALASDSGIIASIDWTANQIPAISSPLDFFGIEQCFSMTAERQVSEVDHRLKSVGLLNLTLRSTYVANRGSFDCAGLNEADYFDDVQRTFTFEERISFKEHIRTPTEMSPILNVPFAAQKALGFGLFTYSRKEPDAYGRTTVDGTEVPLPAIFDLSASRQIRYVLTGLPKGQDAQSREIRTRITQATREVVGDINRAFREALAGTGADRSDDVVVLEVEDNAGLLGDLDKNQIFYVEKLTDTGIIGLGGAHHNPRNGRIEAASVYLYGGNMMSAVSSLKKMAKAQREYAENTAPFLLSEQPASAAASGAPQAGGRAAPRESRFLGLAENGGRLGQVDLSNIGMVSRQSTSIALPHDLKTATAVQRKNALSNLANRLGRLPSPALRLTDEQRESARLLGTTRAKIVSKTLELARSLNILSKPKEIERLFNWVSAHPNDDVRAMFKSSPIERLRAANLCVRTAHQTLDALATNSSASVEQMSDIELLVAMWKPTLAHELGHNLGLRHNFEGSFDKANWTQNETDHSSRTYSSIMDYLSDDHLSYDGFGPQDVAALRAAYAGKVELEAAVLPNVQTNSAGAQSIVSAARVRVPVVGGKFVSLADYPRALGLSSWLEFTKERRAVLPIKNYRFCSDEDAGLVPTCNLFDMGSTPQEIVTNAENSYRSFYSIVNFPGDRLRFNVNSSGAYIGRIFSTFVPIRQFLEETLYQSIQGADADTVNAHLEAAIEGLFFFHNVIRTPDAPSYLDGSDRFKLVAKQIQDPSDESKVLTVAFPIERKWSKDLGSSTESDRLRVRGIELDKTIALIMLTERNMGFRRYDQASLNLSYPDLEKMLLPDQSVSQLPTMALLQEVLADRVNPEGATVMGPVSLPMTMKAETTETMRLYAIIGSTVSMDASGLDASDNLSRAFRTLSQMSVPNGRLWITLPGSSGDLIYSAQNDASVAVNLVREGATRAQVRNVSATVSEKLARIQGLLLQNQTPDVAAQVAALTEQIDAALDSKSLIPRGFRSAQLLTLMNQITTAGAELLTAAQSGELGQLELYDNLQDLKTQLENLVHQQPATSLALEALVQIDQTNPLMSSIVPASTNEFQEVTLFRNVELMSSFFTMMHPEYLR